MIKTLHHMHPAVTRPRASVVEPVTNDFPMANSDRLRARGSAILCAEEKTVGDDKYIYNPSCLVNDGRSAWFKASWTPEDYPASRVVWSSDNAQVRFLGGNTGAEACVWTTTSSGGDHRIILQFGDCLSACPSFGVNIVDPKYINLYIVPVITSVGEAEPKFEMDTMLHVGSIYSQCGIYFNVMHLAPISCPDVTPSNVRVRNGASLHGRLGRRDGLTVYVVPFSLGSSAAFVYGIGGREIVYGPAATPGALAHEIGHSLGLYDMYEDSSLVMRWNGFQRKAILGLTDKSYFALSDWPNGSGVRYYGAAVSHSQIIQRLLMYWIDRGTGRDIPIGSVMGVKSSTGGNMGTPEVGWVQVGVENFQIPLSITERVEE